MVLARERSELGLTVVESLAVLLLSVKSLVGLEALAVLVTLGAAWVPTATVKVIVEVVPDAKGLGLVQVTVCPDAEQLQLEPVPETKLSPVGKVSVTVKGPVAVDSPLLVTLIVYVPFCPTVKLPLCDLFSAMSAVGITVVGSLALLLPGVGSVVVLETVAVLVTVVAAAPTATVKLIVELAPEAKELEFVQVTVCPEAEQIQFVPVPDTKVKPVGKVSVTVIA